MPASSNCQRISSNQSSGMVVRHRRSRSRFSRRRSSAGSTCPSHSSQLVIPSCCIAAMPSSRLRSRKL